MKSTVSPLLLVDRLQIFEKGEQWYPGRVSVRTDMQVVGQLREMEFRSNLCEPLCVPHSGLSLSALLFFPVCISLNMHITFTT